MEKENREILELLLKRRLESCYKAFDELEEDVPAIGGFLAANVGLLGESSTVLRKHAQSTLRDLIGTVELFCSIKERLIDAWELYEDFLNSVSLKMLDCIKNCNIVHRQRASELVSEIISEGRKEFERAVVRLKKKWQADSSDSAGAEELDDRLPLNRRAVFDRDLPDLINEAKSSNSPCALIMVDIDHFKSVNDQYGHPVGDEVLLKVARILVERVGHRGKAYRYGGEEFAVLLPGYSAEEAFGLAERVRKDIEFEPASSKQLLITASFGAVSFPGEADSASQLLKGADDALYKAKKGGRNRVKIYSESG